MEKEKINEFDVDQIAHREDAAFFGVLLAMITAFIVSVFLVSCSTFSLHTSNMVRFHVNGKEFVCKTDDSYVKNKDGKVIESKNSCLIPLNGFVYECSVDVIRLHPDNVNVDEDCKIVNF